MHFKISKSHSVKGLEKYVNSLLASGWILHGNMITTFNSQGKPIFYIQALKKE